jgi:hypothetical protein
MVTPSTRPAMTAFKALLAILVLGLVAAAGLAASAWRAPIDPAFPPKADSFDPERIRHGAKLAAIATA